MLDREINYYKKNKRRFRELYSGKYIVVKGQNILGVYDTHAEAYDITIKTYEVGTFIIKHLSGKR